MRISKLRSSTVRWARSIDLVTIFDSSGTSSGNAPSITQFIRPGREQPHEVVFERQVEAALARVALTAGATPELVVDAAALVALGAEHVQTAEVPDVRTLGGALLLEPIDEGIEAGRIGLGGEPLGQQLLLGEALGVAAEQDVDATSGHVGGDGDAVRTAGLRDDVRLALVLLRVEHRVRRCRACSSSRDSFSDFSTEIVPTRTGCPASNRSAMSSAAASNLASSVL